MIAQRFSTRGRYTQGGVTLRVLLVEDEQNVAQMLANMYGYYTSVGVTTAGFPTTDTLTCPAQTGLPSCQYQFFNKNYVLFAYAASMFNGTNFAVRANVRAHFLVCREAVPRMQEGGSIVFISSVAGITPGSMLPAYDASKAAVAGLCRHVALEGSRRRIRANVVAPGLMDTPIGRAASRGRPSRNRTPVPLGRQGTAWEVAYPTVFLLSDEAGYITGQVLVSDGGLTALR